MIIRLLTLFILFSSSVPVFAGNDYYDDKYRGWFSYEVIPDNETDNMTEKPENIFEKKFSKPKIEWDKLDQLHPQQFQALITETKEWAVKEPTQQNITDYLKLQDVAAERSKKFMSAFMYVSQTNPRLSREPYTPTNTYGQTKFKQERMKIEKDILSQYGEVYGLVYFYSPDCSYCDKQKPVLDYFVRKTDWHIHPVNVQGNSELKAEFGIQYTPSIMLVKRNTKKSMLVASGIITASKLRQRIYRAISYLEGKTNINTYGRQNYMDDQIEVK